MRISSHIAIQIREYRNGVKETFTLLGCVSLGEKSERKKNWNDFSKKSIIMKKS